MDQAIGRAVRIGQTEQVQVHHLVLKEEASMNIDRKMLSAAEGKRTLCQRFLAIARNSYEEEEDNGTDMDLDEDPR
jgi:SNF2 family DNA or RNA helicase